MKHRARAGNCLALVLLCVYFSGCKSPSVAIPLALSSDADATKIEILQRIPVGTSLSRTKKVMESNGFDCQIIQDEGAPVLYCDYQKSIDLFVSERWQVKFRGRNAVKDVDVSYGMIGP